MLKTLLRFLSTIAATVALLLSFAQAPFAHMHRREPGRSHPATILHSHVGLLSDRSLAFHGLDGDDDVRPVDWVVLARDSAPSFVAVISEPLAIPAPVESYELLRVPAPRAHDPPGLPSLPPRAPPV